MLVWAREKNIADLPAADEVTIVISDARVEVERSEVGATAWSQAGRLKRVTIDERNVLAGAGVT